MKRVFLIAFIFITGCAPWVQVGGLYEADSLNFTVELPKGWMRLNTKEYLLATRDGILLQYILIKRVQMDKKLAHTKKKFKKGMLPQEVAEVALDDIESNPAVLNFKVIENTPSITSGFPGFRALFTFKNKDGLKLKSMYYGFLAGKSFYGIRYTAASRYYFDKDRKTFEKVRESFKLMKTEVA